MCRGRESLPADAKASAFAGGPLSYRGTSNVPAALDAAECQSTIVRILPSAKTAVQSAVYFQNFTGACPKKSFPNPQPKEKKESVFQKNRLKSRGP